VNAFLADLFMFFEGQQVVDSGSFIFYFSLNNFLKSLYQSNKLFSAIFFEHSHFLINKPMQE